MDLVTAWKILDATEKTTVSPLRRSWLEACIRYAAMRTDWALAESQQRREMDASRTRAHDALIDACNVLSRNMAQRGEDITWRQTLGHDRKEIGDFACYIHCLLGLSAR